MSKLGSRSPDVASWHWLSTSVWPHSLFPHRDTLEAHVSRPNSSMYAFCFNASYGCAYLTTVKANTTSCKVSQGQSSISRTRLCSAACHMPTSGPLPIGSLSRPNGSRPCFRLSATGCMLVNNASHSAVKRHRRVDASGLSAVQRCRQTSEELPVCSACSIWTPKSPKCGSTANKCSRATPLEYWRWEWKWCDGTSTF